MVGVMAFDDIICYHCKETIDDMDFLGDDKTGFIHIRCLNDHVRRVIK